mgnify:FL=1
MKFLERIPCKHVYEAYRTRIYCHIGYYDHPLSGLLLHNRKLVYFNWEYDSEYVYLFKLTLIEKLRLLFGVYLFAICVGTHCIYTNGKRKRRYYRRWPKWLPSKMFNAYYRHKDKKYKQIARTLKTQCGVERVQDCKSDNVCKYCSTSKLIKKISEPYRQLDYPNEEFDE